MKKILIVQARFYEDISEMLLQGAVSKLEELGYEYEVFDISGALEIPYVINLAAKQNKYDGFIALGCVIRGETSHYDIVTMQSAYGIMKLTIEKELAIGNGIIAAENREQAYVRADADDKDKGGFAAMACASMIRLRDEDKI